MFSRWKLESIESVAMEMVEEGQSQVQSSPKRMKFQEIVEKEEEEVDRISALPDCLLIEILSHLPSTKYCIRTGTLSKRWKQLWTLIHALIFKQNRFRQFRVDQPLSEFVSLVDKTLTQCRQLKIKRFELISDYSVQFESQFNNWIRYAISCNVEVFALDIRHTCFDAQLFDQKFFTSSCFTELTLSGYLLNPTGAISWQNLRSLCISREELDEDLIENILSGSPQLETLVLDACHVCSLLDITSKSVKNLVISGYRSLNSISVVFRDIIKINAPNILSLTIVDDLELEKLVLLNVSSLVEANLDYAHATYAVYRTPKNVKEETLKGILLSLRHVKEIIVGSNCSKVLSGLEVKGFFIPSIVKSLDAAFHWSHRFGHLIESEDW